MRPKREAEAHFSTPPTSSRDGASVNMRTILPSNERVIASQRIFLPAVTWRKNGLGAVMEFFSILFIVD
jgi:hypothetical protein